MDTVLDINTDSANSALREKNELLRENIKLLEQISALKTNTNKKRKYNKKISSVGDTRPTKRANKKTDTFSNNNNNNNNNSMSNNNNKVKGKSELDSDGKIPKELVLSRKVKNTEKTHQMYQKRIIELFSKEDFSVFEDAIISDYNILQLVKSSDNQTEKDSIESYNNAPSGFDISIDDTHHINTLFQIIRDMGYMPRGFICENKCGKTRNGISEQLYMIKYDDESPINDIRETAESIMKQYKKIYIGKMVNFTKRAASKWSLKKEDYIYDIEKIGVLSMSPPVKCNNAKTINENND